jgi:hypothetical protein
VSGSSFPLHATLSDDVHRPLLPRVMTKSGPTFWGGRSFTCENSFTSCCRKHHRFFGIRAAFDVRKPTVEWHTGDDTSMAAAALIGLMLLIGTVAAGQKGPTNEFVALGTNRGDTVGARGNFPPNHAQSYVCRMSSLICRMWSPLKPPPRMWHAMTGFISFPVSLNATGTNISDTAGSLFYYALLYGGIASATWDGYDGPFAPTFSTTLVRCEFASVLAWGSWDTAWGCWSLIQGFNSL